MLGLSLSGFPAYAFLHLVASPSERQLSVSREFVSGIGGVFHIAKQVLHELVPRDVGGPPQPSRYMVAEEAVGARQLTTLWHVRPLAHVELPGQAEEPVAALVRLIASQAQRLR